MKHILFLCWIIKHHSRTVGFLCYITLVMGHNIKEDILKNFFYVPQKKEILKKQWLNIMIKWYVNFSIFEFKIYIKEMFLILEWFLKDWIISSQYSSFPPHRKKLHCIVLICPIIMVLLTIFLLNKCSLVKKTRLISNTIWTVVGIEILI